MNMFYKSASLLFAIAIGAITTPAMAQSISVDTELVLAVDVSGSVDTREFALQRDGYVAALQSQAFLDAVESGQNGSIAVAYVYWSSSQEETVAFTEIFDTASANAFALAVANAPRPFDDSTNVAGAISFSDSLFDNNGFDGARQVIDISGDGLANVGGSTAAAADAFIAGGGEAINAIAIGGGASLTNFFEINVQRGPTGFTTTAASFADFEIAIEDKLVRETTVVPPPNAVPEPGSLALFGAGVLMMGFSRARRRNVKR